MAIDCYRYLTNCLPQRSAVVATVIHRTGSVPREIGATMVIESRDHFFGTIGGGAGEAKVLHAAQAVLETGRKQTITIDLTGAIQSDRPTEGICGGTMEVWLERWQGQQAHHLSQTIVDRLNAGQTVQLGLSAEQLPQLDPDQSSSFITVMLPPPPLLLIVGAGHVGQQLAIVAHLAGFQIAIQDDRPTWANSTYFPRSTLISTDPIAQVVEQLQDRSQLYAALVTRGYVYDLSALEVLLQRSPPCEYIGMIGSQRRVQQVIQSLSDRNITLSQTIHAPIGLEIGALTPAEIAVSITAELIAVRRGGHPKNS